MSQAKVYLYFSSIYIDVYVYSVKFKLVRIYFSKLRSDVIG